MKLLDEIKELDAKIDALNELFKCLFVIVRKGLR